MEVGSAEGGEGGGREPESPRGRDAWIRIRIRCTREGRRDDKEEVSGATVCMAHLTSVFGGIGVCGTQGLVLGSL